MREKSWEGTNAFVVSEFRSCSSYEIAETFGARTSTNRKDSS